MTEPIDFRAAVLQAVEARGWNTLRVSQESGVGYSQVRYFLRGERGLTDAALGKLCGALGITIKVPRAKR